MLGQHRREVQRRSQVVDLLPVLVERHAHQIQRHPHGVDPRRPRHMIRRALLGIIICRKLSRFSSPTPVGCPSCALTCPGRLAARIGRKAGLRELRGSSLCTVYPAALDERQHDDGRLLILQARRRAACVRRHRPGCPQLSRAHVNRSANFGTSQTPDCNARFSRVCRTSRQTNNAYNPMKTA